jgi:hypothetical protein
MGGEPAKLKYTLRVLFILPQALQKASFLRDFDKINNPAVGGIYLSFAERGGFEPPVPF